MIHQRTLLSVALLLFLAAAVPGPAQSQYCPTPAAEVLMFANPSVLSPYETSLITVIARRDKGCSPAAFERVALVADGGTVIGEVVLDDAGEAQVTFTPGPRPGSASVIALMPGAEPVSVRLEILQAVGGLFLQATPRLIPRWDATIDLVASVVDLVGLSIAGQIVVFECHAFSFWERVPSDTSGRARVALTVEREELSWIDRSFTIEAFTLESGFTISHSVEIEILD